MTVSTHVTQKYSLGPVKPWVENAAYLLGNKFGITTIYGWRQSDPFPDHPSGHALDYMISSSSQGEALKDYAVANHNNLGIKYIIWNRRYYSDSNGWQGAPYTATSNPHTDHVHITFLDGPAPWTNTAGFQAPDDSSATATLTASVDETCAWHLKFPVSGDTCLMDKTQVRALVGGALIVGGAVVMLFAVALLTVYGLGQTSVGRSLSGVARMVR